jgi:hypothetical protein
LRKRRICNRNFTNPVQTLLHGVPAGNIAYKTGRKVYWDAEKGEFKNAPEANGLMKATYHNGWKLPVR